MNKNEEAKKNAVVSTGSTTAFFNFQLSVFNLHHELNFRCCGELALRNVVVAEFFAVHIEFCEAAFLSVRVLDCDVEAFSAESLFD